MESIDLIAYFDRIGYAGSAAPTLATLRELIRLHTQSIAFENLDPLLRRPVQLDAQSLQRKLVTARRGGYCFEHNSLLQRVLRQLQFNVRGLAARVLWNVPAQLVLPRTHMVLRVEISGVDYIVDVGFGVLTLTGPLRLVTDIEQSTPHETFRLREHADGFVLEASIDGAWRALYRFDLQEQSPADYEVANWYVSTHPQSHFVHTLIAARSLPGRRYTLRNLDLAVRDTGGVTQRIKLSSVADVRTALSERFGIVLPDDASLNPALDRLCAAVNASESA